ncbi:unnamed protein product [Linum tenue]|uniref:F-box domain-containing protein n=2 Tax=Linum tenue TaxID=586396 RepID=A0AAV0QGM6_9ROSI|nr:unnamed protein product [Linum tenue]
MGVKKKLRKGNGPTEDDPQLIAADDRISSLPNEIIHNILSRLDAQKQAVFTSALSRTWLDLWRSYPVVEFRQEKFCCGAAGDKRLSRFAASARRFWKRRSPLVAFRLTLPGISRFDIVDGLIASALRPDGGSPLEVVISTGISYSIPEGSFSNCSRTKVLKLQGCDLNGLGRTISLHSLQVLDLRCGRITEQLLHQLVGNAPNLESLSLEKCFGIERLDVSASYFPKLKTLEIHTGGCWSGWDSGFDLQLTAAPILERLVVVELLQPCKLRTVSLSSAPNLKFVRIRSYCRGEIARPDLDVFINQLPSLQVLEIHSIVVGKNTQMEINLTSAACLKAYKTTCKLNVESPFAAPNLKDLEIGMTIDGFTQCHLDDLLYKLPCLESLSLNLNNGSSCETSKIKLRSDLIRKFQLYDCDHNNKGETLQELEIDAPNLVNVLYFGSIMRLPGKIDVVNVGSDCQFVVEEFCPPRITTQWFLELRQSLSTLSSFHLVMVLGRLDLSQQVSFDLDQVECSSPPLIIQALQLGTTSEASPNNQNDNPLAIIRDSYTLFLELPYVQNCVTFLDGLFWACRPILISIAQDSDANRWFAKVMCKQLTNKDDANCCVGAKCWRHELRDVKIENASHVARKISKNDMVGNAKISFILTWW